MYTTQARKPLGLSVNAVKEREQKDQTAFQQCFLLALLNQHARITLKRPKKISTRTSTIPLLTFIEVEASRVDVYGLASEKCEVVKSIEINKKVPIQTADRRFNKNISAFIQNFVFDACLEFGYFFDSKLSKNSMKSIQTERIQNVFYEGAYCFSRNDILSSGKRVNDYLVNLMSNKRVVTLEAGDLAMPQSELCFTSI
ncbi:hypothetical protein EIN_176940 [Entamoeba invadens IP1]|uniref:hypothetical protein n=1 Tax=Entamoeba invadens IP1 TaxID=370355 RepID=UPI0002C3E71F|nr:hypothetical protein EIN_176940 [Entamoeba invadens IP1]ELP93867.1 hypothetical protein EIN_176940 [Entamoeba invadens IP1]|eukprot:XP_004260638.1 hypothetical protein EIN_176940 [Entamoeba invadens IP1]